MLKSLAAALVLANVGYLAWSHGWLYQVGMLPSPLPHTEPARMAQQLRAESIEFIREPKTSAPPASPAETKPSAPEAPPETDTTPPGNQTTAPDQAPPAAPGAALGTDAARCAQLSTPLSERQFSSLRMALTDVLPDSAWTVSTSVQPARWIVYSGKFASTDTLAARKAELRQLQVEFRDVTAANLQPGLAMGTYSTEAGAQQALRDVSKSGVKGAKVVIERPEATLYTFKLPEATDAIQTRFKQLMDRLPPDILKGKTLQACG